MFYYTVNRIGDGTEFNSYRPDLPEGIPFVGNVGADGEYLIVSPVELADTLKRNQLSTEVLEDACNVKGFNYTEVFNGWFVGGV